MMPPRSLVPFVLFGAAVACESVPNDQGSGLFPPTGAIRGNVVYSGPHPCSSNGHIVGNGVVLVFDRRNLPPPNGLASTALNFGVVEGDALFPNEPRNPGSDVYCPADHGVTDTVTATASFAISPLAGGSYVLESFFDSTGDFFPTFKFRELPEKGDVGGGAIDTADALKATNAGNLNYQPHFLPVDVGVAQPLPEGMTGFVPNYVLPADGFVADNVTVTMGEVLTMARPYFYPQGSDVPFDPANVETFQAGPPLDDGTAPAPDQGSVDLENANYAPILTIPQDIEVYAPPTTLNRANVDHFESRFPHLVLEGGVPSAEAARAVAQPLHFQLPSSGSGTIGVWQNASFDPASQLWVPQSIPEGNAIPDLWPLVVLTKLVDDPPTATGQTHTLDPASLTQQGSLTSTLNSPVVVLQAITLLGDYSLYDTTLMSGPALFDSTGRPVVAYQDRLNVLLRPNVICFDNLFDDTVPDKRGTLVTPYLTGLSADLPQGTPATPIVSPAVLMNPSIAALVAPPVVTACLPTGRYAINVVYPDGQAWTVPDEAGACSESEGPTDFKAMTCTAKPRSVIPSQGPRAVVEITATTDPNHCQGYQQVPTACLPHAPPPSGGM
jgi:hypothetical protein